MNHLFNAIRKCRRQYKRHWGGYLLPQEVLALRDFGVDMQQSNVDIAIYRKRHGIPVGRWTYFDLRKGENEDKFKEIRDGIRRT